MYAGTNVEICALEKFVHLAGIACPPLKLVSIEVPDDSTLFAHAPVSALPEDWAELPSSASAQNFGQQWLVSAANLVLFVPSVIVPEATNAIINPNHPAYNDVKLKVIRDFSFDARMFKNDSRHAN